MANGFTERTHFIGNVFDPCVNGGVSNGDFFLILGEFCPESGQRITKHQDDAESHQEDERREDEDRQHIGQSLLFQPSERRREDQGEKDCQQEGGNQTLSGFESCENDDNCCRCEQKFYANTIDGGLGHGN